MFYIYGWLDVIFRCRVEWICDQYDRRFNREG